MRRGIIRWLVLVGASVSISCVIAGLLRRSAAGREAPLRGNDGKRVFHGPDCRYFHSASSTVGFSSREEAIDAGYHPCKVCDP